MDALLEAVLKTRGLAGLFMIIPVAALWFLWRAYARQEKVHAKALEEANAKTLVEAQARVEDAKKITEVLTELVSEQSSLNKETNLMLAHISSTLDRASARGA